MSKQPQNSAESKRSTGPKPKKVATKRVAKKRISPKSTRPKKQRATQTVASRKLPIASTETAAQSTKLTLLSPYRFPINSEKLAMHAARYAGVFFVLIGGFFALMNMQYLSAGFLPADSAQLANVWSDSFNLSTKNTSGPIEITIDITDQAVQVQNVRIDIRFPGESWIFLADATQINSSRYTTFWNSTDKPDGTYQFRAKVVDASDFGHSFSKETAVEIINGNSPASTLEVTCDDPNDPIYYSDDCGYTGDVCDSTKNPEYDAAVCESSTDSGNVCDFESIAYDTQACTGLTITNDPCDVNSVSYDLEFCGNFDSTDPAVVTGGTEEPDVQFTVLTPTPLKDMATILFEVQNATGVDAYVYSKKTSEYLYLGAAQRVDGNKWQYYWQTLQYPDGEYRLKAVVTTADFSYSDSDTSYVSLRNYNSTSTESNSEDFILDSAVITLQIQELSPISGEVNLKVLVDGASNVKVRVHQTEKEKKYTLKATKDLSNGEWTLAWNTEQYPNGTYEIEALGYGIGDSDYRSAIVHREVENVDFQSVDDEILTTDDIDFEDPSLIDDTIPASDQLYPAVRIIFPEDKLLSDAVTVKIKVRNANFIEVYAYPEYSTVPNFLGLAKRKSGDEWIYRMDTNNAPNGTHKLFVKISNAYGVYESDFINFSIFNDIVTEYSLEEEVYVDNLEETRDHLNVITDEPLTDDVLTINEENKESDEYYIEPADELIKKFVFEDTEQQKKTEGVLIEFMQEFNILLDKFAQAVRNKETDRIARIQEDMLGLRRQVVDTVTDLQLKREVIEKIDTYIEELTQVHQEITERNEKIIQDRVGDAILSDSDEDGISDYDEVNLYATDPFEADSDGDGFLDGAEILGGYDPTNSVPEAIVLYESPQDTGIVRDDIFVVESITSIEPDPDDPFDDGVKSVVVISGRALPNSFVTVYVFSNPVVVTVKTNNDGSWSYQFDKELDDGRHEIYVGVTDNAGKIVAKSNPLTFIKTAEAFTPVDAVNSVSASIDSQNRTFFSDNILLLVLSLGVVSIGLVLMLIGMHVRTKEHLVALPKVL